MNLTFDPNLFTQIGLDSGALTMLGTITHKFSEPGEYRGVLYLGSEIETVFRLTVDKNVPIAQVNIDLAALALPPLQFDKCEYCKGPHKDEKHFIVNLEGYAVFHVSSGSGGYSVRVEKAEKNTNRKPFYSGELNEGDFFSAILLRPGTYSVTNEYTKAKGEIVVSYPKIGKEPYRPPDPIRVQCTQNSIEPPVIELKPGQGLIYQFKTPSRVKIKLSRADDGPSDRDLSSRRGWYKPTLPKKNATTGAST
jgi:hypothetical protein